MSRKREIEFRLPQELQSVIYLSWGLQYKQAKQIDKAVLQFRRSAECSKNAAANIELIKCFMANDDYAGALDYAEHCEDLYENDTEILHLIRDCVYHRNHLEEAKRISCNIQRRFANDHVGCIFADTTNLNISEGTASTAGPLLRQYARTEIRKTKIDPSLSDVHEVEAGTAKECDVGSICDEEEVTATPWVKRKLSIRKKNKRIRYFDATVNNALDFWTEILHKKQHIVNQFPRSSHKMTQILDISIKAVNMNEQMLWSRRPLYAQKNTHGPAANKVKLNELFYLRNTTCRTAFSQLVTLKKMAQNTTTTKINSYVERIMTEFYAVTTEFIFPRKFEFINEVYNIVGLKYMAKAIKIPHNILSLKKRVRLQSLLQIDDDDKMAGGNTSKQPFLVDQQITKQTDHRFSFIKQCSYFQERLLCSQYCIEKVYLNHRLSCLYWRERKLDECQKYGEACICHAEQCRNHVWTFLGHVNNIRTFAIKDNYARMSAFMDSMMKSAEHLDEIVVDYVNLLKYLIDNIQTDE